MRQSEFERKAFLAAMAVVLVSTAIAISARAAIARQVPAVSPATHDDGPARPTLAAATPAAR